MREFLRKMVPDFLADPVWWRGSIERAIKTFAQVGVLAVFAFDSDSAVEGGTAFSNVAWDRVLDFALGGAAVSLLTSFASGYIGERGTPSLTSAETRPTD